MSSYSTPTRYKYTLSFATSCYISIVCLTRFGTTESLYPPWTVSFLQLWHLLTLEWARQESARVLTCSLLQCQNSSWTVKFSIFYCPVYARLANQHKQRRIPWPSKASAMCEALDCAQYLTAAPVQLDFRKLVYTYRQNFNVASHECDASAQIQDQNRVKLIKGHGDDLRPCLEKRAS